MAAITVAHLGSFQEGVNPTPLQGNNTIDATVALKHAPYLLVIATLRIGLTQEMNIYLDAGPSSYNEAVTIGATVPGEVGTADGTVVALMDVPPDLWQAGDVATVETPDALASRINLYAVTWDQKSEGRG